MGSLENILEINIAILGQKNNLGNTLPGIVEALFKKKDSFPDTDSEKKGKKESIMGFQQQQPGIIPFKQEEKQNYNPFEMFKEYISAVKNKLYGYYSRIKGAFSDIAKVGYTDKLLKEVEDWGVIYFKTAFKKLARLTPQGIMQRYLEELWIFIPKKMK